MNPPERALVACMDERELDLGAEPGTVPLLPMRPGRIEDGNAGQSAGGKRGTEVSDHGYNAYSCAWGDSPPKCLKNRQKARRFCLPPH